MGYTRRSKMTAQQPQEEQGDFFRGIGQTLKQIPQLAYGVAATAGGVAESVLGEGGIATAAKDWSLEGYQKWSDKIQLTSKESDSFTNAWQAAKDGDLGSLIDFAQYGLGYTVGQGVQLLTGAGVGKAAIQKVGGKAMAAHLTKQIATNAAKLEAKGLAKDAALKTATKEMTGKISQNLAIAGIAGGMATGEIGGEKVAEASAAGEVLTGADIAKMSGAIAASGGLEFLADKVGLGALTKKLPGKSRIAGALKRGATVAPVEAGTEFGQTLVEEYGKGHDAFSAESLTQAVDAAALGFLGGAAMGGAGGAFQATPKAKVEDVITATSVDDAIVQAEEVVNQEYREYKPVAPAQSTESRNRQIDKLMGAVEPEVIEPTAVSKPKVVEPETFKVPEALKKKYPHLQKEIAKLSKKPEITPVPVDAKPEPTVKPQEAAQVRPVEPQVPVVQKEKQIDSTLVTQEKIPGKPELKPKRRLLSNKKANVVAKKGKSYKGYTVGKYYTTVGGQNLRVVSIDESKNTMTMENRSLNLTTAGGAVKIKVDIDKDFPTIINKKGETHKGYSIGQEIKGKQVKGTITEIRVDPTGKEDKIVIKESADTSYTVPIDKMKDADTILVPQKQPSRPEYTTAEQREKTQAKMKEQYTKFVSSRAKKIKQTGKHGKDITISGYKIGDEFGIDGKETLTTIVGKKKVTLGAGEVMGIHKGKGNQPDKIYYKESFGKKKLFVIKTSDVKRLAAIKPGRVVVEKKPVEKKPVEKKPVEKKQSNGKEWRKYTPDEFAKWQEEQDKLPAVQSEKRKKLGRKSEPVKMSLYSHDFLRDMDIDNLVDAAKKVYQEWETAGKPGVLWEWMSPSEFEIYWHSDKVRTRIADNEKKYRDGAAAQRNKSQTKLDALKETQQLKDVKIKVDVRDKDGNIYQEEMNADKALAEIEEDQVILDKVKVCAI